MQGLRPFTELGQKAYDSALLVRTDLARAALLQEEIRSAAPTSILAGRTTLEAERDRLLAETKACFPVANAALPTNEDTLRGQKRFLAQIRRRFDGEARAIEKIRSQSAFVSTQPIRVPELAGSRESAGPMQRALIPDRFLDEVDEPYFNAGNPPRVYDPVLGTALTLHADGEVLPEDKAVIILLHGAGAVYSSSNALLGLMNDVAKMETSGGKKRAFATIAVDLPFHGFGPRDPGLKDLSAYLQYLHGIVSRYTAYGKPVFLFGRSFGAVSAVEYACRYRDIAGVIHMSGLHKDWAEENVANMHANGFGINQDGLDFATAIMRQLTYFDAGAVPLVGGLILQGEKDVEYDAAKQRALWPVLGPRLGYGVRLFADGEHNLFDPKNSAVHKAARAAVHGFMLERVGAK